MLNALTSQSASTCRDSREQSVSKFSTWENCQVIVIIDQGPYDLDTTYVNSLNIWRAEILPGGIVGNERHRVAKFIRDDQGNVTVEWHIARPIGANFDT